MEGAQIVIFQFSGKLFTPLNYCEFSITPGLYIYRAK
jgi:hypothetical protein